MSTVINIDVKKLREEKGLSQQQLADATGIPKGRINGWEQQGSQPKVKDYEIIKKFFSDENKNSYSDKNNSTPKSKDLSLHAIIELIESNKTLADAAKKQAEANIIKAEADKIEAATKNTLATINERLSTMLQRSTGYGDEEIHLMIRAQIDRVLEAVAEMTGKPNRKKALTPAMAYEELRNIAYAYETEVDGGGILQNVGSFGK